MDIMKRNCSKYYINLLVATIFIFVASQTYGQSNECSYSGTAITVGSSCSYSTFNSNNSTDYWANPSGCGAGSYDDAWWYFTATGTTTTITYTSNRDAVLHLFTGACATNMTYLACSDATSSGAETISNYTTVIGQNYAIRIQRYQRNQSMSGSICVYSPQPPPSNDACAAATSLPCATSALAGTTVSTVAETAPGGTASQYGVWYTFTGDGSSTTISSVASFDHEQVLLSGSCGSVTLINNADAWTAGGTETYTFTSTIGTTYYVYIAHWSTSSTETGTFTISRTCAGPPSCVTAPTSPTNGAIDVSLQPTLDWPAATGATSYDVYFGTSATPPLVSTSQSGTTYTPAAPLNELTAYYWRIVPKNGSGDATGCSTWSFTTKDGGCLTASNGLYPSGTYTPSCTGKIGRAHV